MTALLIVAGAFVLSGALSFLAVWLVAGYRDGMPRLKVRRRVGL